LLYVHAGLGASRITHNVIDMDLGPAILRCTLDKTRTFN